MQPSEAINLSDSRPLRVTRCSLLQGASDRIGSSAPLARCRWATCWSLFLLTVSVSRAASLTLTWDGSTATNVTYRLYQATGATPFVVAQIGIVGTSVTTSYDATVTNRWYVTSYSTNYARPESDPSNVVTKSPPPAPLPGLTFEAESGTITTPFYSNGMAVQQDIQTTLPSDGGRLSFQFTITNAGLYAVNTIVSAPDGGSDSFFVNIDSEPTDQNVWSIPNTIGFEIRDVRYTGETNAHQFALTAMAHVLIFRGREPNCAIDRVTIVPITNAPPPQPIPGPPPAPTNLRAVQVTGKRLDLAWNGVLDAATEVERSVNASAFALLERVAPGNLHTTTTVNKNQDYVFRCRMVNAQGTSAYSNNAMVSTR